ncbi:MAG: Acetylornithine deacetylase [Candidatus Woesebacteria bacterium GW2011_GWB1_45_5]|uniref:Acetylornithine deacetylase n=1 Tax=Candidatus Woesebacteria bacterium GW2011_GWB1_45_5 TaxID=1618581 RepID=A0A0G1MQ21_9BACT|nr:MAG: Acetylornithine deacetylase [Candidatus Woesebacteria bacterium GW2011_GWB1_45_5]
MYILIKLIQINSVTGKEEEIQKYILDLLTSYGLKPLDIKGNIVVLVKGTNPKKCLIFNAHADTVSPGDAKLWKESPFSGMEKKGKIYGLGSSDNKSSVATLLLLAKKFAGKKPECDVLLTFTVGEEVDGHGTNDTVKWLSAKYLKEYKNVSAIVCEPTGLKCVGLAHKGNLFLKITTFGKSGHGSKPIKAKDHSVLKMAKVIGILENLNQKWKKKYKNQVLGTPTLALATSITAGNESVPNKFPDFCSSTFDVRTIPEMHNQAFKEIEKAIGKIGKVEYLYPPVSFGFTDKDSVIAELFKKLTKLKFVAFPGSTDMPFFTQKGIPTVIFGPGEMDKMHNVNEYCHSKKVKKCMEIFLEVIKGYNNFND